MFTADRSKLGELIAPRWLTVIATITAAIIIFLNLKLLVDFAFG
jgi:manganese transport protein